MHSKISVIYHEESVQSETIKRASININPYNLDVIFVDKLSKPWNLCSLGVINGDKIVTEIQSTSYRCKL